jgi:hypothetical protein
MSWSKRFMEKKAGDAGAGEGDWTTVSRAGGRAGGSWSRAQAAGGGGGGWPRAGSGGPREEPKPTLNMDSEEQFPSLGAAPKPKPRPTAEAAKKQGFAALAASWAHQDAEEAAEQKRVRDEAMAAADKRAKEAAQYGLLESIMRRREENRYSSGGGGYGAEECGAYGQDLCSDAYGRHSPHSPTYDPEPEIEEEEEEPPRGNPMFNYDEQEEGWATR